MKHTPFDELLQEKRVNSAVSYETPSTIQEVDSTSQESSTIPSADSFPIDVKSESLQKFGFEISRPLESVQSNVPNYVKWGIHSPQPSYVLFCFFTAIALAFGHHFYYISLDGSLAGSASRQQWAITFGASFSFLVTHLLRIAVLISHGQYVWMMIKRRGYTLEDLDRLFSMASDPRSVCSWEFVKHGKIAVLLAWITWFLGLASVTPPGTLGITSGFHNQTVITPWPSVNWSLPGWVNEQRNYGPSPATIEVATVTAFEKSVLQITPPYFNSSYTTKFYGPSLRCKEANATQRPVFDHYTRAVTNQSYGNPTALANTLIVTPSIVEQPDFNSTYYPDAFQLKLEPLVFSAFAPNEGCTGWYDMLTEEKYYHYLNVDQYNNWIVDLPTDFADLVTYPVSFTHDGDMAENISFTSQQLWVQTTSSETVCILGNASFELDFDYVGGVQTIGSKISDFTPVYMPMSGMSMWAYYEFAANDSTSHLSPDIGAYVAIFTSLTNILSGNITMALDREAHPSLDISTQSSQVLKTGLVACQDLAPNYWFDNLERYFQTQSPSNYTTHTHIFDQPQWKCRNKTLAAAIEDLFNNITISMLSTNMSGAAKQRIPVNYFNTRNVYQYNSRNLIISYSTAITVTLVSIIIGAYATVSNGVSHSTSFSSMIATTRNSQLDELVKGSSLGALPLDRDMKKMKLRFGELIDDRGEGTGHIAFGFQSEVIELKRNGLYT